MTVIDILGTKYINGNTAVVIKGNGAPIKNGTGVLDSNGKPYTVISVGMSSGEEVNSEKTTALLVEGVFDSKKMYV